MYCAVPQCRSRIGVHKENEENISFHRFPADLHLKKSWIKNIGKGEEWSPTQHTRICCLHFEKSCYREGYGRKILHSYAVPTIFQNQPLSCKPKLPKKRKLIARHSGYGAFTSTATDLVEHQILPKKRKLVEHADYDVYTTSAINIDEDQTRRLESKVDGSTQTDNDDVDAKLKKMTAEINKLKILASRRGKKLKNLQRKCSRLRQKNGDLEIIVQTLHEKMESEHVAILKNSYNPDNPIIARYLMKLQGASLPKEYEDELKKFALTLHFLSPTAYGFVRDSFNTVLPHPKTLSRWYKSVDCKPGFTKESLDILKMRSTSTDKTLYCALCIDEIAIRKQLQWDGTKYYGHIDIGSEVVGDDLPLASEALTFMLTCINESWKIPVGYFLINGLSGLQKKNLVEQCIRLLLEHGVTVVSLTFDGTASNTAMVTHLGCRLNTDNIKSTFILDETEIAILYDPCHNIKLVRNTLGEKKKLLDANNKVISWHYIELLQNLQSEEGLHAGNKLSAAHVQYEKQKMKVKLATQLLSKSVADALIFCRNMQIPGFEDCGATVTFIEYFNDLFDILNSRNLAAQGYKKPLIAYNINKAKEKLLEIDEYIDGLKLADGTLIINSRRKTGFVGFKICIRSVLYIFDKYVFPTNPHFKFLPVYKLSQDHIEVFFGAIRSLGGFNNNPSAKAFMTAYKKLLVHAEFKISKNGNCLPLDDIRILHSNKKQYIQAINQTTERVKMIDESIGDDSTMQEEMIADHDYIPDPNRLTEYSENVITYIAGYILKKVKKYLLCEHCIKVLTDDGNQSYLIQAKDRGGLTKASNDVIYICKYTEKVFRNYLKIVGVSKVGLPNNIHKITTNVFQMCGNTNVFYKLITHCHDNSVSNNHLHLIIKAIVDLYLKIRIHHECKKASLHKIENVRNFYNKLVLFKGL